MNLSTLRVRASQFAIRGNLSLASVFSQVGITIRTFQRGFRGCAVMDLSTAARLMPLVRDVSEPGEIPSLEVTVHGCTEPVVILRASDYAALIAERSGPDRHSPTRKILRAISRGASIARPTPSAN